MSAVSRLAIAAADPLTERKSFGASSGESLPKAFDFFT
jgi:hypothetical protein